MPCDQSAESLSLYLDNALAPSERDAVASHLATCGVCRACLESLRAVKHVVARLPSQEEPPGAVRAHVEALRLNQRPRWRWRSVALAAAAAVVMVIAATLVVRRGGHTAQLAEDLIADHLSSVPEVKPAEIASSDRGDVVRFFAEHLPFAAVVPELPGTQLLGARLCRIEGRRVELLFYRRENRTLSLFVTDSPVAAGQCWAARGHHVCSRSDAQLTLLLVGELPADELRRLLDESVL